MKPGAGLRADQHPAYDEPVGLGNLVGNDHGRAHVTEDASTNQAERLFSRMRRAAIGIFDRMSGKYLDWYAADIAWRVDMRRTDFRKQAKSMLASAMKHPREHVRILAACRQAKEALVGVEPAHRPWLVPRC